MSTAPEPVEIRWWLVVVATAACVLLAGLLSALAEAYGAMPVHVYASDILSAIVWTLAGVLAMMLRPRNPSGRLMLALGLVVFANASYGWQLSTDLTMRPLLTMLGLAGFWFGLALVGHLLLTYPTGRPSP